MKLKLLGAAGLTAALVVGVAAPAFAHVTTDPDSATKGGTDLTLGFRVPNEEDAAGTTQVEIDFPTDHPILGVLPAPVPGWTARVTNQTLNPPVQTDDGPVSQAVSQIIWSGGTIAPGQFQEFPVLAQTLPKDVDQVVFKAIQTYSNGDVVRWIDPVQPGQKAPDHPTPILALTAPPSDSTSTTAPAAAAKSSGSAGQAALDTSKLAKQSSVDTAKTIGIIGVVVGALGLIVAVAALLTRRRPTPSG
jgi:uncharacterized protein YcnI